MASSPEQLKPILPDGDNTDFADFDYGAASSRLAPMRASYTIPSSSGKWLSGGHASGAPMLRRAKSQPTLTRERMRHIIPMSPLFYRRYYMSKAGTMTSSSFNLVSSTLGAGVLALPSAMCHSGLLMGTLALAIICLATVYSVYLLVKVSELVELNTYEELAEALIGSFTEKLTAFMVVVFCWGVGVMFVIVMGDFVSPLVHRFGLEDYLGRRSAMFLFWLVFMFPLSLAREINTLRFSSFIGAMATVLLAVSLIIRVVKNNSGHARGRNHQGAVPLARFDSNALSALSTYLFSYCCQPVVFRVKSEMRDGTTKKMTVCASCAMVGCTLIYIVTGVCGALAFGDNTKPNILSNLGADLSELYVQMAYFGMAITVTMVFPMTIFPTRDSVVLAMGYRQEENPCPAWASRTVAALLAAAALLVGMYVPNVRVLLDLLGGAFGGTLSFLLPGLFALRCGEWTVKDVGLNHVVGAWCLTILGAVMCVLGTYCSIRSNFFVS